MNMRIVTNSNVLQNTVTLVNDKITVNQWAARCSYYTCLSVVAVRLSVYPMPLVQKRCVLYM